MTEASKATPSAKLWVAMGLTATLAGVIYVYQAAFPGAFVYDDIAEISGNYRMGDLTRLLDTAFRGVKLPARPLAYASFSVNHALIGPGPSQFLALNVLIHFASCLLLLRLLWLLTCSRGEPQTPIRVLPLCGLSLCWAVHPLNVSAVAYIYQRMEKLDGLFVFGGNDSSRSLPSKAALAPNYSSNGFCHALCTFKGGGSGLTARPVLIASLRNWFLLGTVKAM